MLNRRYSHFFDFLLDVLEGRKRVVESRERLRKRVRKGNVGKCAKIWTVDSRNTDIIEGVDSVDSIHRSLECAVGTRDAGLNRILNATCRSVDNLVQLSHN